MIPPLLYSVLVQYLNCKRLREFEEIEISRQSFRGVLGNTRRKTLKTFCLEFGLCRAVCPYPDVPLYATALITAELGE
jgi:hypothetical protein